MKTEIFIRNINPKNVNKSELDSIVDLNEKEVIQFVIKQLWSILFEKIRAKEHTRILYNEKKIIKNKDLDILLIDPQTPENAIVIECKRIKVLIEVNQNEKINKVEDLRELVGQVNDRIKRGFHKVYLTVLIVCDGRNKIANNTLFNHASTKTLDSIYNHRYLNKLDPKAGILFLEPSQLTAKDYNSQSGCGIYEMRKPIPQKQTKELTEKIISLIK